jgi:MFS superfamily sulfate permease-like transporter
MFFANAPGVGEKMWPLIHTAKPRVVLIDGSAVFDLEYTALKMLIEAEATLRREGIALWLAALNPEVLATVQRSTLGETLGRERMFFSVQMAVDKFQLMMASGAIPRQGLAGAGPLMRTEGNA